MKTLKLSGIELFRIEKTLQDSIANVENFMFKIVASRNLKTVSMLTEDIKKQSEASEKYKEFATKRNELQKKFADKDDKGQALLNETKTEYVISKANIAKLDKEAGELEKEYQTEIDLHSEKMKEYFKVITEKEKFEVQVYPFKKSDIPTEILDKNNNLSIDISVALIDLFDFED